MKKLFVYILFFFSFSISNLLFSQNITLPFECGFEDSLEVSQWHLKMSGPMDGW